jgi:ABC-type phosphate/phosphonate transport system permease subunit
MNYSPDARQWLFAMLNTLDQSIFIFLMLTTLWVIWNARRKAIYKDLFQSPISTFDFVERFFLRDLKDVNPTARRSNLKTVKRVANWTKPLESLATIMNMEIFLEPRLGPLKESLTQPIWRQWHVRKL